MSDACPSHLIHFAVRLADTAGAIVRKYYRTEVIVEDKPDSSPVTEADRAVERELRALIEAQQPEHGVVGEEEEPHRPDAEYVWVLDPIDGTKAFISGIPVFGTLIALTHKGGPILGVIDQPITGERWIGACNHPTTWNGTPVHTRACNDLKRATLCATTPEMFVGQDEKAFARIRTKVKLTRYGTDCYAYGLVSMGLVDLVVEAGVSAYDYLAHVPIVEGAGGVITDWKGHRLDLDSGADRIVAAGDAIAHAQVISALAVRS